MSKLFKNQYLVAIIILSIALLVSFNNVVFRGKTLLASALTVGTTRMGPYHPVKRPQVYPIVDGASSAWQFEPFMYLNSQAYKSGQLPLWNPYNGAGQPLAADMQSSGFFPLVLPLILNPSTVMWDFFLLLRLFAAGFFTFLFLRLININKAGSLIGAVTFMLGGYRFCLSIWPI